MEFIAKFRQIALGDRRRVYVDFRSLRKLDPCGALVLAAELDRWRRFYIFRTHVPDVNEWDPNVLRLLSQMGLFSLLNARNYNPMTAGTDESVTFLPFMSALTTDGRLARDLRL